MQGERLLNEVLQLRDSGAVYQVLRAQDKAFFYSKSWGERRGLGEQRFAEDRPAWGLGYLQMPVFGYDLEAGGGSKSFVLASYERFHDVYAGTPPKQRFYYELVQEVHRSAMHEKNVCSSALRICRVTSTSTPSITAR